MENILEMRTTLQGLKIEIHYHLFYNIIDDEKFFGISLITYSRSSNNKLLTKKTVKNITSSFSQCLHILELLHRNSVTPITLVEVLNDLSSPLSDILA